MWSLNTSSFYVLQMYSLQKDQWRILGVGDTEMGPNENFGCGTLQIWNCSPLPQEGPYETDIKKLHFTVEIGLWYFVPAMWLKQTWLFFTLWH